MKKRSSKHSRFSKVKGKAARRLGGIKSEAGIYRGQCLFPAEEIDGPCVETPVRCHVIPRSLVLDNLMDTRTGKVLEFDWGVGQWAHLLLQSDEKHPVDLDDPATYSPRLLGTHEACTSLCACQRHDHVFDDIDVSNPDFEDPYIRLLTLGRMGLHAADLCSRRKFLVDRWNRRLLRGANKSLRIHWAKEAQVANYSNELAHSAVKRWCALWESVSRTAVVPDGLIDCAVQTFRSKLSFASCLYFRQGTAVVVIPFDGDRHRMAVLNWGEDRNEVQGDQKQLLLKAKDTEVSDEYRVEMVVELMSGGNGSVAASPNSYAKLDDEDRLAIQQTVLDSFGTQGISQSLRSAPPGNPVGWRKSR